MVIISDNYYSQKSKKIFYDSNKYIYFIFEKPVDDFIITIYNKSTDTIFAYRIPTKILNKNLKLFNVPFFTVKLSELLEKDNNRQEYMVFVYDEIESENIYSNEFIIKQKLLYDIYGYEKKFTASKNGTYIEQRI